MRRYIYLYLVAAVLLLAGCGDIYEEAAINRSEDKLQLTALRASIEPESTRTYINNNVLRWHNEDRVSVFFGSTTNNEYIFAGDSGSTEGDLVPANGASTADGEPLDRYYAVYPYSASNAISADGIISAKIRRLQQYADSSFGRQTNVMVAATDDLEDNILQFKNVCGYLVLKLYGNITVSKIEIEGMNGEPLCGNVSINCADEPILELADDADSSILISCGDGVALSGDRRTPTEFWVVLPPTTLSSGFKATVTDSEDREYQLTTYKRVEILRNIVQPMSAMLVEYVEEPASNELWYSTNDGSILTINEDNFGNALIFNDYVDGRGVVKFAEPLTSIPASTFENCSHLTQIVLPSSVKHLGDKAFKGCSSLSDVKLGSGVESLGDALFEGCMEIANLTLPASVRTFGDKPFYGTVIDNLVVMCDIPDIDDSDGTVDQSMQIFGGATIGSLTLFGTMSNVGNYAFAWDVEVGSVTIEYGVERIGNGVFWGCDNIKSVSLPETIVEIGSYAFAECGSLTEVVANPITPPALGAGAFPNDITVYVPDASISDYKMDTQWSRYNIMSFGGEIYESTDYSADGKAVTLQKASEGNGIDIVFMGEAYSDRQIASGYYRKHITTAMEALFSIEPYKSFRYLFNVYMINCVSKLEGYSADNPRGSSAFNCVFGEGTEVGGDEWVPHDYTRNVIGDKRKEEALMIVIINSNQYAGTCYMSSPSDSSVGDFGNGYSVCYFTMCGSDEMLSKLLLHEAGGHGFAKLGDEYFYSHNGHITSWDYGLYKNLEVYGWYKNVDYSVDGTLDSSNVKWRYFLEDERYAYDGLGVYEGAMTYTSGAYRPTESSIMRSNEGGYNAPSREAIYIRIHKLAYGKNWKYDYEDFVEYDAINRKSATPQAVPQSVVYGDIPHTSPIVVR